MRSPADRLVKVGMRRLLRVSAVLTLIALALMVWSMVAPTPMPIMLAMSLGQGLGTLAFALFGFVVFQDFLRIRREARKARAAGGSRGAAASDSLSGDSLAPRMDSLAPRSSDSLAPRAGDSLAPGAHPEVIHPAALAAASKATTTAPAEAPASRDSLDPIPAAGDDPPTDKPDESAS